MQQNREVCYLLKVAFFFAKKFIGRLQTSFVNDSISRRQQHWAGGIGFLTLTFIRNRP
jgi:hypothetical protein